MRFGPIPRCRREGRRATRDRPLVTDAATSGTPQGTRGRRRPVVLRQSGAQVGGRRGPRPRGGTRPSGSPVHLAEGLTELALLLRREEGLDVVYEEEAVGQGGDSGDPAEAGEDDVGGGHHGGVDLGDAQGLVGG